MSLEENNIEKILSISFIFTIFFLIISKLETGYYYIILSDRCSTEAWLKNYLSLGRPIK